MWGGLLSVGRNNHVIVYPPHVRPCIYTCAILVQILVCCHPRIRLSNVGSNQSINLEDVGLSYWFDGPIDAAAGVFSPDNESGAATTSAQFKMSCSDISTDLSERRTMSATICRYA